MVKGESRYFTLSPIGGGSLNGYTARYELLKMYGTDPIKQGAITINNDTIPVALQTNDLDRGTYTLNIFITAADNFTQAYAETFEVT